MDTQTWPRATSTESLSYEVAFLSLPLVHSERAVHLLSSKDTLVHRRASTETAYNLIPCSVLPAHCD
jgi:hypothetical protein